jgi:hypothetical protein
MIESSRIDVQGMQHEWRGEEEEENAYRILVEKSRRNETTMHTMT